MKPIMRYNLLVFNCALLVVPTNFTKIEKKPYDYKIIYK